MNIKANDINFCGRYLLRGKIDDVNRAMITINSVKGNNADFLPITCGENKICVVATDDDALMLKNKKTQKDFSKEVKEAYRSGKNALLNLFQYLFTTTSDALIIQGENLKKFALPTHMINFDDGSHKSKYKSEERFVDGTIKRYTLKGRLCEMTFPDGRREEFNLDGSRKIIHANHAIEIIPAKEVRKKQEEIKKQPITTKSEAIRPITKATPSDMQKAEPMVVKFIETPREEIIPTCNDVLDNKGRISKRFLDNDIIANYYYKDNSNEVLFVYYSDGRFESENGTINEITQTISFPNKNGTRNIYNKFGIMEAIIFPDGTRKNFDENMNLLEKIYPDGTVELFNREGRMYCIVHQDGSKEYIRRKNPSVFSA